MAVDRNSAQNPAFVVLRRILDPADESWLHEQAGADRFLIRQFRAQRRRTFYATIGAIRQEVREARLRWRAAAEQLQDYGGVDWPIEMAKLNLRLGWLCLVGECQLRFGWNPGAAVRRSALRHLELAADFTLVARASN